MVMFHSHVKLPEGNIEDLRASPWTSPQPKFPVADGDWLSLLMVTTEDPESGMGTSVEVAVLTIFSGN